MECRARQAFDEVRSSLGRAILLGLEVLVVADIIRTIVVTPTLSSAATLGVIVLVRILLSFSIDVEVDGVLPWRRGAPRGEMPADLVVVDGLAARRDVVGELLHEPRAVVAPTLPPVEVRSSRRATTR